MKPDRLASLADPRIVEYVSDEDGLFIPRAKPWCNYTDREKAECVANEFGCGIEVALMLLDLQARSMGA